MSEKERQRMLNYWWSEMTESIPLRPPVEIKTTWEWITIKPLKLKKVQAGS